jgi:hypothetical protein
MTSQRPLPGYVLVEGKNDKHVIQNLCRRHGLPLLVQEPDEGMKPRLDEDASDEIASGLARLLFRVTARLKEPSLEPLGVVLDADLNLFERWQRLRGRLMANGYLAIPEIPVPAGWISADPNLRRIGVWLMPDNQQPGILEDFVATLIPSDDPLRPKATAILSEIEQEQTNRYSIEQRTKALIHTWLAWQEIPGQPMGLAITVRALGHDSPTALAFIAWLRRLFDPTPSPQAV